MYNVQGSHYFNNTALPQTFRFKSFMNLVAVFIWNVDVNLIFVVVRPADNRYIWCIVNSTAEFFFRKVIFY
jgi:hypothetical protein